MARRRHIFLPLYDCLYALQPSTPDAIRSFLHRHLPRDGITRLPDMTGDKPQKKRPGDWKKIIQSPRQRVEANQLLIHSPYC